MAKTVRKIEATHIAPARLKRVAAYARVSMETERLNHRGVHAHFTTGQNHLSLNPLFNNAERPILRLGHRIQNRLLDSTFLCHQGAVSSGRGVHFQGRKGANLPIFATKSAAAGRGVQRRNPKKRSKYGLFEGVQRY